MSLVTPIGTATRLGARIIGGRNFWQGLGAYKRTGIVAGGGGIGGVYLSSVLRPVDKLTGFSGSGVIIAVVVVIAIIFLVMKKR